MEEQFFFVYHLRIPRTEYLSYPTQERKWIISRFIEQKEFEAKEMAKARSGKK